MDDDHGGGGPGAGHDDTGYHRSRFGRRANVVKGISAPQSSAGTTHLRPGDPMREVLVDSIVGQLVQSTGRQFLDGHDIGMVSGECDNGGRIGPALQHVGRHDPDPDPVDGRYRPGHEDGHEHHREDGRAGRKHPAPPQSKAQPDDRNGQYRDGGGQRQDERGVVGDLDIPGEEAARRQHTCQYRDDDGLTLAASVGPPGETYRVATGRLIDSPPDRLTEG